MEGVIAVRLILYHLGTPSQRLGNKKAINSYMKKFKNYISENYDVYLDMPHTKKFKATAAHLPEVRKVFPNAKIEHGIIHATKD
jgi:hypothetical protein